MQARGARVVLLSGDAHGPTGRIAGEIGADEFQAGVNPAGKAEVVASYTRSGNARARVAMVGDGINDAPALAAADLEIAMGSGTDLAMHSAPIVLMGSSLMKIPEAMDLARRTRRVLRQNLFWAFFYNATGIAFAAVGVPQPPDGSRSHGPIEPFRGRQLPAAATHLARGLSPRRESGKNKTWVGLSMSACVTKLLFHCHIRITPLCHLSVCHQKLGMEPYLSLRPYLLPLGGRSLKPPKF